MNTKGFTVIELAVVVMVVGFLLIPAFQAYDTYLYEKRVSQTRENLSKLQSEISIYMLKTGRYPCPSDRSRNPNDPLYGTEDCSLRGSGPVGGCSSAVDGEPGRCRIIGTRDIDGDGVRDNVLVGGIPFRTIADTVSPAPGVMSDFRRITSAEILDGWGNQFSYAVSEPLVPADIDDYSDLNGTILMMDEFSNPVGDYELDSTGNPSGRVHFTIISHGKDGIGGFSAQGTRLTSCASGVYGDPEGPPADGMNPPGTYARKDIANCDATGSFITGLDHSEVSGNDHYDDSVTYASAATSALWDVVRDGSGNATDHIHNLNDGNVGFGTATPQTDLEVAGDIRAESGVMTPSLCDASGNNCFNTSILIDASAIPANEASENITAGIRCSGSRIMTGISQSQEQCSTISLPSSGWTAQTCGTNASGGKRWLRGIRTDGIIECTN